MKLYKKEKLKDPRKSTGKKPRFQENPEQQLVYKIIRYHENPGNKVTQHNKKGGAKKLSVTIRV